MCGLVEYLGGDPRNPWMRGEGKAACMWYVSEQFPTLGSQAHGWGL